MENTVDTVKLDFFNPPKYTIDTNVLALEGQVTKLNARIDQISAELAQFKRPFSEKSAECVYTLFSEIKNHLASTVKVQLMIIKSLNVKQYYECALDILNKHQAHLDTVLPPNRLQKLLDDFYVQHLKPLLNSKRAEPFLAWIESNKYEAWYKQLGLYLLKLPLKAVRNTLLLIYNVFIALVKLPVHPLDSAIDCVKLIISTNYALTCPETLTQIGIGTWGSGLGEFFVASPNPYLIGVGGVFLLSGLIYGVAQATLFAEKGKNVIEIKKELWKQIKSLPESFLTGLVGGLIKGGVQKLSEKVVYDRLTTNEQVRQYLDREFLKKYHLPEPESWLRNEPPGIFVDPVTRKH